MQSTELKENWQIPSTTHYLTFFVVTHSYVNAPQYSSSSWQLWWHGYYVLLKTVNWVIAEINIPNKDGKTKKLWLTTDLGHDFVDHVCADAISNFPGTDYRDRYSIFVILSLSAFLHIRHVKIHKVSCLNTCLSSHIKSQNRWFWGFVDNSKILARILQLFCLVLISSLYIWLFINVTC